MSIKHAPEDKSFVLKSGSKVNNVMELYQALHNIDKETLSHHVNESKNDFYLWVRDVLELKDLAEKVHNARTKIELKNVISRELDKLEETGKFRKEDWFFG